MNFVLIFGPQAVGKMTVGEELSTRTGLKLFHNHMTIEFVNHFFSYGTSAGKRLVHDFRFKIFEEVAKSDLPGLIFTYVWALNEPSDGEYVEKICDVFEREGGEVYFVELEAAFEERLYRNGTPHRLEEKPTKRDLKWSESNLRKDAERYRLNSLPGEIARPNYMRIDNTALSADEVASMICDRFSW